MFVCMLPNGSSRFHQLWYVCQTDGRADGVQRLMRPPREGCIIMIEKILAMYCVCYIAVCCAGFVLTQWFIVFTPACCHISTSPVLTILCNTFKTTEEPTVLRSHSLFSNTKCAYYQLYCVTTMRAKCWVN